MPWTTKFDVDATLDKAMQHFWTYGFHATTMQNLVDNMGINRASIYNTYGDKHELFIKALEHYHHALRHHRLKELTEKYQPPQRIHELFQLLIEDARQEELKRGCLIMNTALEMAPHDKAIQEVILKAQNSIRYFFISALQDGIYKKQLREDIDVDAEAQFLLTLLSGLLVQIRNCKDEKPLHALLQSLDRHLEAMML